MPYAVRFSAKSKSREKQSTRGRKQRKPRKMSIERKVLAPAVFKRSFTTELNTTSGTLAGAPVYQASQITNISELENLYDQYRIIKVKIRLIWRSSSLSQVETTNNNAVGMPIVYHAMDSDDSTVPATKDIIMEYNKHKIFDYATNRRTLNLTVYPRYSQEVYRTGVTTAYSVGPRKAWLDLAYTNIEHYAWKYFIDVPQSGGTLSNAYFDLIQTYYIECKDAR